MGIILDIILVAIIALNVFICYKKGLVKLAVGLIAVLVSVILAVLLYKPVSNIIINNTELDEKIKSAITENFVNEEETTEETEDNGFMKYIEKYVEDPVNKTKNEIVIEASGVIATKLIDIIAMVSIFIVARLVLILLTFVTDMITSLPILKQFNKLGGIIYGALRGILIIYVALLLISFFGEINPENIVHKEIEQSFIGKEMYNKNIINLLIK